MRSINQLRQRGMALISVLLLVTVIMVTLATLFYRHQIDIARVSHSLIGEQAVLLALSGENWVQQILKEDRLRGDTDDLTETWAYPIPPIPVEGGELSGCLIDMQSRFNVNNLAAYDDVQRLNSELQGTAFGYARHLLHLFSLAEFSNSRERVMTLADWIDKDSEPNPLGGAEDNVYTLGDQPKLTGNRPLVQLDEIAAIAGFEQQDLLLLSQQLVALPKAVPLNINTASPEVLKVLMEGMDDVVVQSIVDARPFTTTEEFYLLLAETDFSDSIGKLKTEIPLHTISVSTEFFQLNSIVSLGGVRLMIQSLLYRPSSLEIRVLQRKLIPLPRLVDKQGQPIPDPIICPQPTIEDLLS